MNSSKVKQTGYKATMIMIDEHMTRNLLDEIITAILKDRESIWSKS